MMYRVLIDVFRRPAYVLGALLVAFVVFASAVWLPNIGLVLNVIQHPTLSLFYKCVVLVSLLGSFAANSTPLSAFFTISIALLFGVNIALAVFLIKQRASVVAESGVTTSIGLLVGVLGIGCAACGSLILTSVLSLIGAAGVLAYLPLRGGELGVVGILALLLSIYLVAKRIHEPLTCQS